MTLAERPLGTDSMNHRHTLSLPSLAVLGGAFVALYHPVLLKLIHDWGVDENYSHGYFIPFIVGYMIWQRKEELRAIAPEPSFGGLLVLLVGLAQLLIAWVGTEYFFQGTSMIVVLAGTALFLGGPKVTKRLLVPMAYLIFMIPLPAILWNQVAFPMKLFASFIAGNTIQALGYTVLREGNILTLPNITLEVADACSGLRSLTSLLALSGALAYLSSLSAGRKWLLFLSAAPIAVLCNVIRLTATAILARHYGSLVAEGFLHSFSGWLVFIMGVAMLAGVHGLLKRWEA